MIDRITLSGALIAAAALAVSAVIVVLLYFLVGGTDVEQEVRLVGIVTTPQLSASMLREIHRGCCCRAATPDRSVGDLEEDYIGTVSYSSTNPSVARVGSSGIVTGMETGGTEISIHLQNFTAIVPVLVWGPVKEVPPVDMDRVLVIDDDGAGILLNRVMVELEPGYSASDAGQLASDIDGLVVFEYPQLMSIS